MSPTLGRWELFDMRTFFAILIVLGALVYFFSGRETGTWSESSEASEEPRPTRQAREEEREQRPEPGTALEATEDGRVSLFFTSDAGQGEPEGAFSVQGHVLDARGHGIGGLGLSVQTSAAIADEDREAQSASCDARGQFVFTSRSAFAEFRCADDRWCLLFGVQDALGQDSWRCVMVAAPTRRVAGVVVDASGRRITDATVAVRAQVDLSRRYGLTLHTIERRAQSGEDGAFDLGLVPVIEPMRLTVESAEWATRTLELDPHDDHDLRVVLSRE